VGRHAAAAPVDRGRLHSRHTDDTGEAVHPAHDTRLARVPANRLQLLRHYDVRVQLDRLEPPALFLARRRSSRSAVAHPIWPNERRAKPLRILQGHGHLPHRPDLDSGRDYRSVAVGTIGPCDVSRTNRVPSLVFSRQQPLLSSVNAY
jgi:hypothetical protein